jgi:putative transcriptional regulator
VSISNRIRELRFNTGEMTQQQLADSVGITRQTIIALEQGKYSPSLELAFLIAETFGVGVEDVFQHQDAVRSQAARKLRKSSER